MTRRKMLKLLAAAAPAVWLARSRSAASADFSSSIDPPPVASGPFEANWQSLKQYKAPDWFRDAKFGIWAHWSAQCVPEQGDWYARNMYIQGNPQYNYHVAHYGHPTQFGFKDIDHLWKVENWDPDALMDQYVKAGAKYFVALANHHDNFDCYESTYHAWNSTRIGPMKDIIGTWAKVARGRGLRFGVTNHSSHAWHWFQTAFGYDVEGPLAGVRYDGFSRIAEGTGQWWEGFDPQQLYVGPSIVMPDGITSIKGLDQWIRQYDSAWHEEAPPSHPEFTRTWFLRCQELIDKYQPDLLYFDDTELPLGHAGLDIAAHFYNSNINRLGRLEAVLTSKGLQPDHVGTMVLDIERGRADRILGDPWQTDTCIGNWHYQRSLFEHHRYKTAGTVIQMLCDIVSKNGNLLLNIPVRGDGTIDSDEEKVLDELAAWMPANGEAIFGTRPFTVFGEGPPDVKGSGNFNEKSSRPYTSRDIRFTTKGDTLYAIALGWPEDGRLVLQTLAAGSPQYPKEIAKVELLGSDQSIAFTRGDQGLVVTMPQNKPNEHAFVLKITPAA
ncbi:MAG TPA: alpha-L-fucosidase [Tepidisphaeraceae bacterium]|nr:alpha-L-fucosidase [Tepidisphaeraceae bacterium]